MPPNDDGATDDVLQTGDTDEDPLLDTSMTIAMRRLKWAPHISDIDATRSTVASGAYTEAEKLFLSRKDGPFSLLRTGDTESDCDVFSNADGKVSASAECYTSVIRLVADAVADVNVTGSVAARSKRPCISLASKEWNLNTEQHTAFVLMASSVLREVLKRIEFRSASDNERAPGTGLSPVETQELSTARERIRSILSEGKTNSSPQLRMGMYGKGGTGKSRVIQAIVDFAKRWFVADSVVITATSGIAGVMINGSTYHRALGLKGRGTNSGGRTRSSKFEEYQSAWSKVALLVVDEISMASGAALSLINMRLQELLNQNTLLFGGVDVCFTGDFYQLEPVGGVVYSVSLTTNAEHSKGYHLYRQMNAAVELYHSHRHSGDKTFDLLCDSFRRNQVTKTQLKLLNKECLVTAAHMPPPCMSRAPLPSHALSV